MNRLRSFGLPLLALACSCQATETERYDPLPYSVAVATAEELVFFDETPAGSSSSRTVDLAEEFTSADPDDVAHIEDVFASILEERVFTRALPIGIESGPEGDESLAGRERRNLLARIAVEQRADLLLLIETIAFDTRVETERDWTNLLWFLAGPTVYFFEDRRYLLDATVEASLYDVSRFPTQDEFDAADPDQFEALTDEALVRRFRAKPDWVPTKFGERAENLFDYAQSLVIPTSFLRSSGGSAAGPIAEKSMHAMAAALARNIAVDEGFLGQPGGLATSFRLTGVGQFEERVPELRPRVVANGEALQVEFDLLQRRESAGTEFRRDFERWTLTLGKGREFAFDGDGSQSDGPWTVSIGDPPSGDDSGAPGGWVRKRVTVSRTLPDEADLDVDLGDAREQLLAAVEASEGVPEVRVIEAAIDDLDRVRASEPDEGSAQDVPRTRLYSGSWYKPDGATDDASQIVEVARDSSITTRRPLQDEFTIRFSVLDRLGDGERRSWTLPFEPRAWRLGLEPGYGRKLIGLIEANMNIPAAIAAQAGPFESADPSDGEGR